MILRRILLAFWLFVTALAPAFAQDEQIAVLVADQMFLTETGVLIAEGNVEAHQGSLVLTASRVSFDPKKNELLIDGPIRLTEGDRVEFLADSAALNPELTAGLMKGARLVLDQRLQLAAVEINRDLGRYTQLYKVVATSCRICGDDTPPIWQIRAQKVIHDSEARQLYFENAQFRILDMPVFYLPRLRMPDPTLTRATGFLIPEGRVNSQLGTGIKIPYFIKLGDHRDLTLTPYLSGHTTTLEYRYRQSFSLGDVIAKGAISQDRLSPDRPRAYLFADGRFELGRGYDLDFDVEVVSDDSYLLDYGYSGKDRLDSSFLVSRIQRDAMLNGEIVTYKTLRADEVDATQPSLIVEAAYERRLYPDFLGGELRLSAESHSHYRESSDDFVGRDVSRAQGTAHWLTTGTTRGGMLFDLHGVLDLAAYVVAQDDISDDESFNVSPAAYGNLRYPLIGSQANGTTHLVEPVAHFAVSNSVYEITNEESTRVEFDEANLLSLSRFPAPDRFEEGIRLAYGGNWTRFGAEGLVTRLSLGQVIRNVEDTDLTVSSGLNGLRSNWVVAGQVSGLDRIALTSRALFDEEFTFAKAETRASYSADWGKIAATHIWLIEDPDEDRPEDVSEVSLETSYALTPYWTANLDWQFDLASQSTSRAGLGFEYENECLDLSFAASRRFTSSTTVDPSTDFDFRVGLRGFGAGRSGSDIIRKCGN